MVTYITKEGDVLDWICWKHYGTISVLEKVMEVNPKITDERLAAGIEVKLPYIEIILKNGSEVRLWN